MNQARSEEEEKEKERQERQRPGGRWKERQPCESISIEKQYDN